MAPLHTLSFGIRMRTSSSAPNFSVPGHRSLIIVGFTSCGGGVRPRTLCGSATVIVTLSGRLSSKPSSTASSATYEPSISGIRRAPMAEELESSAVLPAGRDTRVQA